MTSWFVITLICNTKFERSHRVADRRIQRVRKNKDGDILKVGNYQNEYWSPRDVADVISDIENKNHSYYVNEAGYRSEVHVVNDPDGKYIRTTADASSKNNLDNLPNDL